MLRICGMRSQREIKCYDVIVLECVILSCMVKMGARPLNTWIAYGTGNAVNREWHRLCHKRIKLRAEPTTDNAWALYIYKLKISSTQEYPFFIYSLINVHVRSFENQKFSRIQWNSTKFQIFLLWCGLVLEFLPKYPTSDRISYKFHTDVIKFYCEFT